MITDLVQIRRLGEKNRAENERFRKYLKRHAWVERQFRNAAHEIHDAMNCRECAECCRMTECEVSDRDIKEMSKFLGIKPSEFRNNYTMEGSDGEVILKRNDKDGCVFLAKDKSCSIYEGRPANCRGFPHILRGPGSIESRMWELVDRATYCPIVYNWIEACKGLTKFK